MVLEGLEMVVIRHWSGKRVFGEWGELVSSSLAAGSFVCVQGIKCLLC